MKYSFFSLPVIKKNPIWIFFFIILIFFLNKPAYPQFETAESYFNRAAAAYLLGEASTKTFFGDINEELEFFVMFNEKVATFIPYYNGMQLISSEWYTFEAPPEISIVDVTQKSDAPRYFFILLSNGEVILFYIKNAGVRPEYEVMYAGLITSEIQFAFYKKIIGDALYVIGNSTVYVSRDTARTWNIDSTGLGQYNYVNDIAEDSLHYVYAATNNGLYKQHPDSNQWHKIESFPGSGCYSIFYDRQGKLYAADFYNVYVSNDDAESWTNLPELTDFSGILSMGDDSYGNLYVITYGGAYRLDNSTNSWINISIGINSLSYLNNPGGYMISNIQGDSILYAATKFGNFQSDDFGDNWTSMPNEFQFNPNRFYSLARVNNYHFISTNLGLFRIADGDTVFTKVFPSGEYYFPNLVVQTDGDGNLYIIAPPDKGGFSTILKSSGNGNTWSLDTLGLLKNNINISSNDNFLIDKNGNQFLFNFGKNLSYFRTNDTEWRIDTTGLNLNYSWDFIQRHLSNGTTAYCLKNEFLFPGNKLSIYKRNLPDENWDIDSSGLSNYQIQDIIMDNSGNLYVFAAGQNSLLLFKKAGNQLIEIQLPQFPLVPDLFFKNYFAFDSQDNLWLSFVDGANQFYQPRGLYFTKDDGQNWTYAGMDSIGINKLVAIEDTVYALSFIDGLFSFWADLFTSIEEEPISNQIPVDFKLSQNYPNPFNPTTKIKYAIPFTMSQNPVPVKLKIYNIMGQEIATLVNEIKSPGEYEVEFNAKGLSSGIYFYKIEAGKFIDVKKMMILK